MVRSDPPDPTTILIPLPGFEKPVELTPEVWHRQALRAGGVMELDAIAEIGGKDHRFDLVVEPSRLAGAEGMFERFRGGIDRDEWMSVMASYVLLEGLEALTPERLTAARIEVAEIPLEVGEEHAWFDIFDAGGDEQLGPVVDAITDPFNRRFVEDTVGGGTIWWFKTLDVHPRLRGQQIGIRLLAHAIDDVFSRDGDLALLAAAQLNHSIFGRNGTQSPVRDFTKLGRYYARLGFRPWNRKEFLAGKDGYSMVLTVHDWERAKRRDQR